ncbi:MAG TPA: hypothetical protein VE404_01270 [Verrucomicrobiae bacterium]|nr:hypothetical protein [Verrucomicrobiae bacterium]
MAARRLRGRIPRGSCGSPDTGASPGRPGLAFAIAHQGRGANYVVVCWWDRENELPTRVFVEESGRWRPAEGSESICVWDLQVLWFERETYVATLLAEPVERGRDTYLARHLEETA